MRWAGHVARMSEERCTTLSQMMAVKAVNTYNDKGKIHPRTGHEDPVGVADV